MTVHYYARLVVDIFLLLNIITTFVVIHPMSVVSGFQCCAFSRLKPFGSTGSSTNQGWLSLLLSNQNVNHNNQRILLQQLFLSDNNNSNDWYSDYNPETFVNNSNQPPPRYDKSSYQNNNNNNNNQYSNDRDRFSNNNNDRRGGSGGRGGGGGDRGGGRGRGGGGGGGRGIAYERDISMDQSNVDVPAVERLIDERTMARRQNDFDRADEIRDKLLQQYGVQVWDKDGVWRTGASASGSGLSRRSSSDGRSGRGSNDRGRGSNDRGRGGRFGDRGGGRSPRPPKDFGPTGHDYDMSPDAGPITVDISESEINAMIAARLRAKMSRNFDEADQIQGELTDAGVYIHDARKEWRADGIMFGDYASSSGDGRPGRERESRRDREMAPFDQSSYSAGIDTLTDEELADITTLVSRRNGAKLSRNFKTADRIRDDLKEDYNVFIEDRLRQWSVGGDFGPDSPARDASRFKPWEMSTYSEPLIDEDQESAILVQLEERNEAKAARNFDAADDIRDFLLSEHNVVIDDRLREWSIGGDFGRAPKSSRGGNDDAYNRRGGGDLTPEEEAEIIDLVAVRANAKKTRDFKTSDELRDVLDERFAVKVDDKTKEWWVKTASYAMGRGNNRLADALDDDTIAYIQDRLQERLDLKNDKQYDAADGIRDELRERFGVAIDDRMQEWVIEVDQFTVVNNSVGMNSSGRQQPPPSYSYEEDDGDDDDINSDYEAIFNDEDSSIGDEINDTNEVVDNDDDRTTTTTTTDGSASLETLTIPELKERLRAAGLPVSGKKSELIERLLSQ